jgi:ferrous iron transport protein B
MKRIAVAGNPNSGKTSLFNALTGLNQHVGNYPGITVEKKTGKFKIDQQTYSIVDIPGTYSIQPKSEDERVAIRVVSDKDNSDYPELIIYVADASTLKKSLLFFSQLVDTEIPIILALNMVDIAEKTGVKIDKNKLSEELKVPIFEINAREEKGIDELKKGIISKIAEQHTHQSFIEKEGKLSYAQELQIRFQKINQILNKCVRMESVVNNNTRKIDAILTHKIWGYFIFIFLLLIIFQFIFSVAEYPMSWIEKLFEFTSDIVSEMLPEGILSNLIVNGILAGLSGVLVFIPQIAFLFFFVSLLEDTGYLARVSYIMDNLFRRFGLHGKSVIPLMSGVACAIPAVMSARTISNWKERLITIMVTPLVTCSARLPVYVLIISIIIPEGSLFGVISYKGISLLLLYLIGFVAAFGVSFVLHKILKQETKSYFTLEMPIYKLPRWKNVFLTMLEKVKVFVFDAGKIILAISIILWFLSSFGPPQKREEIKQQFESGKITETEQNAMLLEESYIGIVGKTIEPVISPLGFNWRIGIALITSFAAREVFVGSMATIYSVGDADDTTSIREKMMNEVNPKTNQKVYTFAVGISLLLFYVFAMQCMSTIAVVKRETGSWKWAFIQLGYMSFLAYVVSFVAYQLLSM